MAIPTTRVVVDLAPDPTEGWVFHEDWTDPALARWSQNPDFRWTAGRHSLESDDGLMGSAFLRLGNLNYTQVAAPGDRQVLALTHTLTMFDPTQPIRATYKFRITWPTDRDVSTGIGTVYNGEPCYDGLWSDPLYPEDGVVRYGLYTQNGTLAPGDIIYVELEWDPASGTMRFRNSPSGSWFTAVHGWLNGAGPAAIMFQSPYNTGALDIGEIKVWGTPCWGTVDYVSAYLWEMSATCGYMGGVDMSHVLGGITGLPPLWSRFIAISGDSPIPNAVAQSWEAQSPIVGIPAGYKYASLDYVFVNPTINGGSIALHVRDAATGELISDDIIPGNSTGIAGEAPPANTYRHPDMRRVSLALVPDGTEVYLDVQGVTAAADHYNHQPRLGGTWVSFDALPAPPQEGALLKRRQGASWYTVPIKSKGGGAEWLTIPVVRP